MLSKFAKENANHREHREEEREQRLSWGNIWLDFEEELPAPEEPVGEEADGGEREGKGDGGEVGGGVAGEEVAVGPEPRRDARGGRGGVDERTGGDPDPEHDFDQSVGEDEGEDGVGAEDEPGKDQGLPCRFLVEAADVDEPVAQGEQQQRQAGGEEDVGVGPEIFVQGEREGPEKAQGERDEAGEEENAEDLDGGDGCGTAGRIRGFFAALRMTTQRENYKSGTNGNSRTNDKSGSNDNSRNKMATHEGTKSQE